MSHTDVRQHDQAVLPEHEPAPEGPPAEESSFAAPPGSSVVEMVAGGIEGAVLGMLVGIWVDEPGAAAVGLAAGIPGGLFGGFLTAKLTEPAGRLTVGTVLAALPRVLLIGLMGLLLVPFVWGLLLVRAASGGDIDL